MIETKLKPETSTTTAPDKAKKRKTWLPTALLVAGLSIVGLILHLKGYSVYWPGFGAMVFFYGLIYFLYILLIPAVLLVSTPFILLWPGKRQVDGSRRRRDYRGRYRKILSLLKNLGLGLPSP